MNGDHFDRPLPVAIDPLREVQRRFEQIHLDGADIAHTLRSLLAHASDGIWTGRAADSFRDSCAKIPALLDKSTRSYGDASTALRVFVTELSDLNDSNVALRHELHAQQEQAAAAPTMHAPMSASVTLPCATSVEQRLSNLRNDFLLAEARCISKLHVARDEAIAPLSMWQHMLRTVERIAVVVGVVIAVIAVIAIVAIAWPLVVGGASFGAAFATAVASTEALSTLALWVGGAHLALGIADRALIHDDKSPSVASLLAETVLLSTPLALSKLRMQSLVPIMRWRVASTVGHSEVAVATLTTARWSRTLVIGAIEADEAAISIGALVDRSFLAHGAVRALSGIGSSIEHHVEGAGSQLLKALVDGARSIAPVTIPPMTFPAVPSGSFQDFRIAVPNDLPQRKASPSP